MDTVLERKGQDHRQPRRSCFMLLQLYTGVYVSLSIGHHRLLVLQIIRLPTEDRLNLMEEQISKLYDCTFKACVAARRARYQARMLLDVEELYSYLQEAFNHYSNTLESPFDFVQASSRNSSIPTDFGGNILKLALDMMNTLRPEDNIDGRRIFSELSYMVASCIMLDSARHKNKGNIKARIEQYEFGTNSNHLFRFSLSNISEVC